MSMSVIVYIQGKHETQMSRNIVNSIISQERDNIKIWSSYQRYKHITSGSNTKNICTTTSGYLLPLTTLDKY